MGDKRSRFINRTGMEYGNLTVLEEGPKVASGASWLCRCSCGNTLYVSASNLVKGQKRCSDCGLSHARIDLNGRVFGRLTILKFSHTNLTHPYWLCRCTCGNETTVLSSSLIKGNTQSCGCLGLERRTAGKRTHGMTKHPLYDAWINMKQRCQNSNHKHYNRYGGRGIKVCERWETFDLFAGDLLPLWKKGLTLERIEVNGDYSPENCEWVTPTMQSRNKERTIKVDIRGRTMTLPEVSARYGINQHTLWYRWKAGKQGDDLVKPTKKTMGRN